MEIEQGLKTLVMMLEARSALDARIERHVHSLRERGATWEQIGASIGVTKQAASQRWGKRR